VRSRALTAVILLPCLIFATPGQADSTVSAHVETLLEKARQLSLHQDRSWRRLLHYHPLKRFPADAELEASIKTLFRESDLAIDDEHPRCRFVERERWLRDQLGMAETPVPESCSEYQKWRRTLNAHTVTLVFPAAYLNSPSSMFGHTLLRLDPEDIDDDSSWLSWSLNFTADTGTDSANSAGYAIKGITGAYPGKFHVIPYFQKLQEYGAIENRDIWEYKLDLNPEEVGRIVRHSWELRDIRFAYYFFRENCSFRLLELIDYARPELSLSERFDFTAIPGDTVKAVLESELVSEVEYRPSVGSQFLAGRADTGT